jgi:hypothetical protein
MNGMSFDDALTNRAEPRVMLYVDLVSRTMRYWLLGGSEAQVASS